uniref:phosphoglycolate phosphatase n=1 Tax=Desulfovibrio sp. U5L TaxID=596152 RepID=I2Q160_9BACT
MYVCNPLSPPDFLDRVKGIIFDCDGVLVDSRDANRMYYNLIREGLGMLPITPEEEDYVHMHSVTECMARIIPADRLEEADTVRRNLDYNDIFPYIFLEDGLVELLDILAGRGIRMAVHTNRTNTVERLLRHFEIDNYFSPVVSAGSLRRPKPDPEGVLTILAAWDLPKADVAYIGDSALDERSARAAGIEFWSYKNPGLLAAMYLPDFHSLRRCLAPEAAGT